MTPNLRAVADVLSTIDAPPGLRTAPHEGDALGGFDQWFDGGAIKHVTGWIEYHFLDGSQAVLVPSAFLNVELRLPSGQYVSVMGNPKPSPWFPIDAA